VDNKTNPQPSRKFETVNVEFGAFDGVPTNMFWNQTDDVLIRSAMNPSMPFHKIEEKSVAYNFELVCNRAKRSWDNQQMVDQVSTCMRDCMGCNQILQYYTAEQVAAMEGFKFHVLLDVDTIEDIDQEGQQATRCRGQIVIPVTDEQWTHFVEILTKHAKHLNAQLDAVNSLANIPADYRLAH
jgi:hypothetical protein